MSFDLNSVRESDLKGFTYEETLKVIEAIEQTLFDNLSLVGAIENLDTYLGYAYIIKEKIKQNVFSPPITPEQSKELKSRVNKIISTYSIIANINIVTQQQVDEGVARIDRNQKKHEILLKEFIKKEKKEISDLEHTTLTHVLTIMGIFSAIITIILSLIITTSSWINNSTQADVLAAFTVPNGVALVAVFALMILVYYFVNYHKNDESDDDKEKQKEKKRKKLKPIYIMLSVVVLISALLLSGYIVTQNIKSPAHVRYIISSTQYEVIEDTEVSSHQCPHNTECNCHNVKIIKNYFEFTFEDKLYRFEYDESYKHGEDLYFCIVHCALE